MIQTFTARVVCSFRGAVVVDVLIEIVSCCASLSAADDSTSAEHQHAQCSALRSGPASPTQRTCWVTVCGSGDYVS